MLVVIDLESDDSEQKIFDTINNSGMRLSGMDTVKNALFQKALNELDRNEVIKLYEYCWEKVFSNNEEAIEFWSAKRIMGRQPRDNGEILLQTIAIIKGLYDPDKNTLTDIPDIYKKVFANSGKEEIIGFIKEIREYAEIFRESIPGKDENRHYCYEEYLGRLLHILEVLEISTFHPYIIYLIKKFRNDDATLRNALEILEKFVVLNNCKQETKSSTNFARISLIHQV